jgi:pyruvate ferredoxin oxidoreductase beta subunit
MVKLTELTTEEYFAAGHRLCAGCGAGIAIRQALKAIRGPTVLVNATGCLEVSSTIFPYTAWQVPWIHVAFENTAAVASGIEAACNALLRRGLIDKKYDIIAIGGDGGTFDIGLQALSGALERGHDFVYLCYDNEAYMNTGIQRSGATPQYASTTTSPAGTKIPGKIGWKKDLIAIAVAHEIEYAATASIAYWNDYITKVRKAIEVNGPAVIHVFAPCPRGWRTSSDQSITVARLAVQTRFFPIYEVVKGKYNLTIQVPQPKPIEEYLKIQGRFRHLFSPRYKDEIPKIQAWVNEKWEKIWKLTSQ